MVGRLAGRLTDWLTAARWPHSRQEQLMARAIWNGSVIAESEDTVVVEGNHYFPIEAIDPALLTETDTHSVCPWKGTASYYTLTVDGQSNTDAAWNYPEPKDAAKEIAGRLAFWKGVTVED
jgi:uncharacterized protein (DUF427 family)